MFSFINQLDNELLLELNGDTTPFWDSFMWIVSAKETWIVMYVSLLFIVLKNFSLRTTLIILAAIGITIAFTDQVCSSVIRPYVERMRPSNLNNPISPDVHIVNGYRGGQYGFPSCHSANSFGLAFMIILIFRNKILGLSMLGWACLNSYSRIHLGVHYMGDIVCGMLVALMASVLVYFSVRKLLKLKMVRAVATPTSHDTALIYSRERARQWFIPICITMLTLVTIAIYTTITNM